MTAHLLSLLLLRLVFLISSIYGWTQPYAMLNNHRASRPLSSTTTNNGKTVWSDPFPNHPSSERRKPKSTLSLSSSTSTSDESSFQSRRSILKLGGIAAAATAAAWMGTTPTTLVDSTRDSESLAASAVPIIITTVADAVQWIDVNCDRRFLHAVVASDYRFVYRGVNTDEIDLTMPLIRRETPDLLLPATYGYDNKALQFFEHLENKVLSHELVKPSNGHLATTSIRDAAAWGTNGAVVSIWPVRNSHYAWFADGGLFYPRPLSSSRTVITRDSIIVDGKDCGADSLDEALSRPSCEILIGNVPEFLAVPLSMESELRQALQSSFLL